MLAGMTHCHRGGLVPEQSILQRLVLFGKLSWIIKKGVSSIKEQGKTLPSLHSKWSRIVCSI